MSNTGGKVISKFRETFRVVDKEALHWFPGHMGKGVKQMQQQLKNVDCIIEVHDARVPISGHYADYSRTITGLKPHIFILNKTDLADMRYKNHIESQLKNQGISNILFTNFKDQMCPEAKKILPLATELIKTSDRYNRSEEKTFAMMIIGVPNVGKSSLINRLRNNHLNRANAAHVGAVAGITRSVTTRIKISEDPHFYLLDTPGILAPKMRDNITGLKLALVGCLQDHLVGPITLADFLLFWLNKNNRFEYVRKLSLPNPNDDVMHVLTFIAAKLKKTLKIRNYDGGYIVRPNFQFAAEHFINMFRNNEFGRYCLDADILDDLEEDQFIENNLA